MPGGPLIASSVALFGKLPAHGDFVRRGDAGAAGLLDAWLTGEMERLATVHADALDARLADLGCWAFAGAFDLAGALSGSRDRVGRVFPVAVVVPGGRAAGEQAAALLTHAVAEVVDADALAAALADIGHAREVRSVPDGEGAERWWRPLDGSAATFTMPGPPTGADFDRLLVGTT